MGKTSFALGMIANAALDAEKSRPVLFFSLEMSSHELSQRLLCAEARVDSSRVRNGQLQSDDWTKISRSVGRLAEAPISIDDNPNLTVTEIRRSEEHTSELQSLMRISYAVFCLKKKTKKYT